MKNSLPNSTPDFWTGTTKWESYLIKDRSTYLIKKISEKNSSNASMITQRPVTLDTSKPNNCFLQDTGGQEWPISSKNTSKVAPPANKAKPTHTPPLHP